MLQKADLARLMQFSATGGKFDVIVERLLAICKPKISVSQQELSQAIDQVCQQHIGSLPAPWLRDALELDFVMRRLDGPTSGEILVPYSMGFGAGSPYYIPEDTSGAQDNAIKVMEEG